VPVKNFGLNMRKLYEFSGDSGGSADGKSGQSGKVRYSIKGKASSREKVFEAIKDLEFPPIPNHDAVRIVVIGDESRERVLQLIADQVARSSVAKKPLLDDFARTHWAVADSGYVTKGAPTVYFLRPDGVVIHRQDNEQDLLKALAVALRDPNPRYDPSQDPDLRRNTPWWPFGPNPNQPNRSGNSLMPLLLVLGGFGIVVLLILKGGSK
jgi:hypothetical protein